MVIASSPVPNRLIYEKSPYLLQHAYNPVDWYPWGEEAFAKAKREHKPILVSIGYSTCHWCHVMEHESYEDPKVAELMNRYLVNIKVDREERPDVDKIYMTAVSAMTGSGGWPLNVFLTPDLKPFFGGTYFPPVARWGQPAWTDVVTQIGTSWQDPQERQKMTDVGEHIMETLKQYTTTDQGMLEGDPKWLDSGFESLKSTYDASRGGFGDAPKFPMPVYHNFLLRYYARTKNREALDMSLLTLREMAKGGIYDQMGGGFARYSTDQDWRIPHFEKMLYDNAQLAVNYLEAYQISKDADLRQTAREILDYIRRDMTHPDGGFYSAEDADSLPSMDATTKVEGAFYVWEKAEIMRILGDRAGDLICFRYGIREEGNAAQDPHGEFKNKNIFYEAHSISETARQFSLSGQQTQDILNGAKKQLFEARSRRPRPHLDDKIISGWNGLMISAYAKAYQVLGDKNDLRSAEKAAQFLKTRLYDPKQKLLYRRWRDGDREVPGIADDYAFVVQGLLDLYEADFNPDWLDWAIELSEAQDKRFLDPDQGGFFMTAIDQDPHLLLRVKEDVDNVEPSASSVAALNLLRLAQYTEQSKYQVAAQMTLKAFGRQMKDSPRALPQMLVALDYDLTEPRQVVIVGPSGGADTAAMLQSLYSRFIPVKIVFRIDGPATQERLSAHLSFLEGMHELNNKATAYVCIRHTCKQPTNNPMELDKLLATL